MTHCPLFVGRAACGPVANAVGDWNNTAAPQNLHVQLPCRGLVPDNITNLEKNSSWEIFHSEPSRNYLPLAYWLASHGFPSKINRVLLYDTAPSSR